MQNEALLVELFKIAAREAKASRVASMTLLEQTAYILLVAGEQARGRRQYSMALAYRLTRAVCISSTSMREAYDSLTVNGVNAQQSAPITPVSNTGVTEFPAQVPAEYFTGGK